MSMAKSAKVQLVFHNIVMLHSEMGDAIWFELCDDLGRFSIHEFCLITGLKCVGSTHLPVVESRLISRYFTTLRGVSRENLELQMSNAKFDNDDDAVKLSLLYIMFSIPLSNASAVKIDQKFFALADDLDAFNDFPWGILSWEATRAAICHVTLPSIASKFTIKYEQAIPRMRSWTTVKNVKFDDVVAAFATDGESQLRNPWVARLFLKNQPAMPQLPPPKSSVPRQSTDTNSEWWEFQTEIRGQVASLNKKLEGLKREQKRSNKLLRRVLQMLFANIVEKGEGKAEKSSLPDRAQREINDEMAEFDAMKTTSPDIGSVADIGVQAAMEFQTADKVVVSTADAKNDMKQEEFVPANEVDEEGMIPEEEGIGDPVIQTQDEKVEVEIIQQQDFKKVAESGNDESGDTIPKKKRARLSRLGQRPAKRVTDVGPSSTSLTQQPNALPPGLADEPPEETLEEFRKWLRKGLLKRPPPSKQPPRYGTKHETFDKPHDLGFMAVDNKTWYNEFTTSSIWLWDEQMDAAFYYLRKKIRQNPDLEKQKVTTVDTFFHCEVQSGLSWFEVNTLLMPIHFSDLKHWALVKLELTDWTIEVYDSMHHEGPHNSKVRAGMEALSNFIPLLAERLSLFEFKPRDPPGTYPIPVTIMNDISRQGNGGDCEIFTIKNAECLIEKWDVRYWVVQERMQMFREWMACYLWIHARRKLEGHYKSDEDVDMDF
ncbi:hypothetical protein TIFTF001_037203 [Ficus carica]|uniref:Ubiquitin-like protease family profile domain-containing protein n=1 Tax=Ficus carica TaxID=3494 RepID=A0AA88J8M9_FICCA|nr:hypothetical protein TIFTF001_037187 [Ficus carica]GMN68134.1 hypothetical protein TIFTF001_037189 [Ficus carica]GMN68143.1 hypothetical protein TIFTF001_037201 [Ficus carica]GMN68148.1 hypothetical protein TIFTF001_037203 [Ficus carica]